MELPWQYSFPPFFTLQPNEDTKIKQLDAWCDFVLDYCREKRIFQLDLNETQNMDLFNNRKIERKCSIDLVSTILNELVKRGRVEWLANETTTKSPKQANNQPRKCLILWNTFDEWAKLIYDYVNRNAMQNTVCTFYELTESKQVKNEKFHKIDIIVFRKSLTVLQRQNKAEVFQLDSDSEHGVKFF